MDFSYYKINKLLWRRSKEDGARIVHEVGLSMDKAPPALPAPPSPVVKPPRQPKPDPMIKMMDDIGKARDTFSCFKTLLNTPDPPKAPTGVSMKIMRLRAVVLVGFAAIGVLYFGLFNRIPHGTECEKSSSPDGIYIAERCFLEVQSFRSGNAKYVGRLFDAENGKLLAEHTFITPVPDLFWSPGFRSGEPSPHYVGPSVNFSRGGEDGDGSDISLPPSGWDRLLAARPRL